MGRHCHAITHCVQRITVLMYNLNEVKEVVQKDITYARLPVVLSVTRYIDVKSTLRAMQRQVYHEKFYFIILLN